MGHGGSTCPHFGKWLGARVTQKRSY